MNPEVFDLDALVEQIQGQDLPCFMQLPRTNPRPSREAVWTIASDLQSVIFPGYFDQAELEQDGFRYLLGSKLEQIRRSLTQQVMRGLCFRCEESGKMARCQQEALLLVNRFMKTLPRIREALALDAQAAFRGDPAASSPEETVFCYPGLTAITYHRLAHELFLLEIPVIPRMISERSHSLTGIDIHPGASIGEGLFIDHGTGVVIGETCVIGKNVQIYQGVTLGARSFPLDENGDPVKGVARHPIVEDDVVIYSGATILGRIRLGKSSVVGGNVWLTESLPANSRVSQGKPRHERFEEGSGI